MNGPYSEFREDGWPLCPACGQDELFAGVHSETEQRVYEDRGHRPTISMIEGCYACHWSPYMFYGPRWEEVRYEGLSKTAA